MKPVRLLLLVGGVLVVLVTAALLVAFNSGFQTWAARRSLAGRPALGATLGSLSAGLKRVEVKNLRVESRGAVLTIPALEAELPLVSAGMNDRVAVTRLVAKGWTLDLTKVVKLGQLFDRAPGAGNRASRVASEFSLVSSARAAEPAPAVAAAAAQAFKGIFSQLVLPVDLSLDGVDLEGEVILPGNRGHARLTLTGGGLAAGREGKFELVVSAALTSTTIATLDTHATFSATMDTPRTFTRVAANADATASGLQFPRGVKISSELSATRAASGEEYGLALTAADKRLVEVRATFPVAARKLSGTWKIDVRDADITPFLLGRAMPPFVAVGEGQFDFDAAFAEVHAKGKIEATATSLKSIQPELAVLGTLAFTTNFDLTQAGDQIRVEQFGFSIKGAQPVASVAALQTLTYNRVTHGILATDLSKDLFAVTLQGVPLAWVQPFAKGYAISGGDLRGEFFATASNGGFSLRPKAPLMAVGVSLAQAGKPLLRTVDISLNPSVDYTPHGWQFAAAPLFLRSGKDPFFILEAKVGQLAGADQPIKATGKFSAVLPAILAQPVGAGTLQLTRGDLAGDFSASLGPTQEIQAKVALTNLEADPKLTTEKLPAVSADVRADIAAGGQITLNAPLLFERDGRKSDLSLVGTLTPGEKGLTVAARVSSTKLAVDDVKILGAALAVTPPAAPPVTVAAPVAVKEAAPPWAGINGQLALALKEVVYSGVFQATDVAGTLRIDAGTVKFEGMRAGFGNGSDAKASGTVTFDAKAAAPYALNAELAVTEFDPAPLFKAMNPGQPATVEGKFNVTSKLSGTAAALEDFATTTHGDFQLSSKGGVFRGLPLNVASKVEATGKLAAGAAFLGNLAGAVTGRKDLADVGTRAQALAELTKLLAAIPYDQLTVVLTRDASLNTQFKDLTLISPQIRMTGGGQSTHQAGKSLLDEALAMEFKLRARDHTGELLKFLGALDPAADELGYAACTLPLKIKGTLGAPDTSELSNALANLALDKTGVKDKAGDLLNKLFGK